MFRHCCCAAWRQTLRQWRTHWGVRGVNRAGFSNQPSPAPAPAAPADLSKSAGLYGQGTDVCGCPALLSLPVLSLSPLFPLWWMTCPWLTRDCSPHYNAIFRLLRCGHRNRLVAVYQLATTKTTGHNVPVSSVRICRPLDLWLNLIRFAS